MCCVVFLTKMNEDYDMSISISNKHTKTAHRQNANGNMARLFAKDLALEKAKNNVDNIKETNRE